MPMHQNDPLMRPSGLDTETERQLIALRHQLHALPELSGNEEQTAARIAHALTAEGAEQIVTGLGGHGVAAVFSGPEPGPTVLLRCELDALPITETGTPAYRSQNEGIGHLCGHDGHMTILVGVAKRLHQQPLTRGRVVLLFQPAEETGAGARAVIVDPKFEPLRPDYAFALHNFPGLPLGHVALASGVVNCASRGMLIRLTGMTAHASQPETGQSPGTALAALITALPGAAEILAARHDRLVMATVTHAHMGEPAFGVAPAEAELWATLRTLHDTQMAELVSEAEALVTRHAAQSGLRHQITYSDIFDHSENHPEAVAISADVLKELGLPHGPEPLPWRASEDFGALGQSAKAAMLFLGAGQEHPALHNSDYDFPDALIAPGVAILDGIARRVVSLP